MQFASRSRRQPVVRRPAAASVPVLTRTGELKSPDTDTSRLDSSLLPPSRGDSDLDLLAETRQTVTVSTQLQNCSGSRHIYILTLGSTDYHATRLVYK